MPADLDQLGREYSHGAFIGRKGLIKLGHMAPDARPFLNQVNLKTIGGKIKSGLNAADPSPHNHNIPKITVGETFKNLFPNISCSFSTFIRPYQVSSVP